MTLWSLYLFFSLGSLVPRHFERTEPFYLNPTPVPGHPLRLRNDSLGKGHFGATRGADSRRRHAGIDIAAPLQTPILAPKSGRVAFAGSNKGYGEYVQILHPDGMETRYAHLAGIFVKPGQWVSRGETIGLVGKTGNAEARGIRPHLHFEIRKNDRALDPRPFIEEEGEVHAS
jgi:murein DD-endopeptidase MepM/ murein hydrolase activator NlpD